MSDSTRARIMAMEAVIKVLDQQLTLGTVFARTAPEDDRHRAFARHLASGVLRWKTALDWLASQLVSKPLRRKDQDIHLLILSGLFQLWHEPGEEHAVVHSTAECARKRSKKWAVGLINAVLRRFTREKDSLLSQLGQQNEAHAHPAWLLGMLQKDWPSQWQDIVAANNRQAPLWLRVNETRTSVDDACSALHETGFETQRHPLAPEAIKVSPPAAVEALPGFAQGHLSVQDAAAQLAAHLLALEPGLRVLDACAAPGGKTTHMLERVPDLDLTALDRDPERVKLISQNLSRLGQKCQLLCADASDTKSWWDGKLFDRILLDAPCSATGVIRRHPEIRHLRTPEQVRQARADQHRLLESLWPLLNPGGILVYATCSILERENHEQIHEFLSRHTDAAPVGSGPQDENDWQILPGQDEMDGFYYALLRKSD